MNPLDGLTRRRFLTRGALVGGALAAAGALTALPSDMVEALREPRRRGRIEDVEHVVILMQENRSFDHYYGTLSVVRGFSDNAALTGVFHQPHPQGGAVLPFHLDTRRVNGQRLSDLDHSWEATHAALAGGDYDGWIPADTEFAMAYFTENDIPFHYALADAFTICDHYFCSVLGPTVANRLYMFSGTVDPLGHHGGPVFSNPTEYKPVFRWTTYPERLQDAGVSWRVYANNEVGYGTQGADSYVGDFGDNTLWSFHAYHDALNSPDPARRELAERAGVHRSWLPNSGKGRDPNHVLADFVADCRTGNLPQVSYVVAPHAYSEHPEARPVDGARYIDAVLQALFANQSLWQSTAVFLNYDENDGFFDHVPPPVAPPGTPLEYINGKPIGLGPRVPMTVISPWSRGGWVSSEVYDHTSVIRFLERWTGVLEPNISGWRRAVCGDLTGAFDFRRPATAIPLLPDTAVSLHALDHGEPILEEPSFPAPEAQTMPVQAPGTRPARAVPYQPLANATLGAGVLTVSMRNHGPRPVQLAVYSPRFAGSHLLDAGEEASTSVSAAARYDVSVHGPNGFVRRFSGDGAQERIQVLVGLGGTSTRPAITWTVTNTGRLPARFHVHNGVSSGPRRVVTIVAGATHSATEDVMTTAFGWYDLSFTLEEDPFFLRRFAGHLENGDDSRTHPGVGDGSS